MDFVVINFFEIVLMDEQSGIEVSFSVIPGCRQAMARDGYMKI